jgi:hypothetical protein
LSTARFGSVRIAARMLNETAEVYIKAYVMMTGAPPPEERPDLRVVGGDDAA